jgi:glycosyltransferase involved in cell wall biosynthesis
VLCPYDWLEPFGIVLIEALVCGTPALAVSARINPEDYRRWRHGVYLRQSGRKGGGQNR